LIGDHEVTGYFRADVPQPRLGRGVDGDDAERHALRRIDRAHCPYHRPERFYDGPILDIGVDRREVDIAGAQLERLLEIEPVAFALQTGLIDNPNVVSHPIDPHDLAPTICHTDEANLPEAWSSFEQRPEDFRRAI